MRKLTVVTFSAERKLHAAIFVAQCLLHLEGYRSVKGRDFPQGLKCIRNTVVPC
jgi:hypothetical protein